MDSSKEPEPTGEFKCQLCGLTAPYTYYGQKPPNTHSIVILEDSYVMKDPFTPDKEKFLILGSLCSLCRRTVCVGANGGITGVGRDLWRSSNPTPLLKQVHYSRLHRKTSRTLSTCK
uniref:Cysteine-rich DPF motif domain-containing protein 1 n=1 Tax=Gallus gallus TaxID=9031 RepID=A0A8V0ZYM6_CHICK